MSNAAIATPVLRTPECDHGDATGGFEDHMYVPPALIGGLGHMTGVAGVTMLIVADCGHLAPRPSRGQNCSATSPHLFRSALSYFTCGGVLGGAPPEEAGSSRAGIMGSVVGTVMSFYSPSTVLGTFLILSSHAEHMQSRTPRPHATRACVTLNSRLAAQASRTPSQPDRS